jgi:hypothetical protein
MLASRQSTQRIIPGVDVCEEMFLLLHLLGLLCGPPDQGYAILDFEVVATVVAALHIITAQDRLSINEFFYFAVLPDCGCNNERPLNLAFIYVGYQKPRRRRIG